MSVFSWIIISTLSLSFVSIIGVMTLFFNEKFLKKIILLLVALSAGALIGGAFFHLIPESIEFFGLNNNVFLYVVIGFSTFFLLEQFIHWHHCHKAPSEHKESFTYLVIIADTIHNFIDGVIIASSFIFDIKLGITTWTVVMLHEIPQELGDFGVLIHGGWKKTKALVFNFLSSLSVVLGGIVSYFFVSEEDIFFLLPFAAGSFIYIASSDLIPEIKSHPKLKEGLLHFVFFVIGISFVVLLKF